jgi:hypothetical protein
MAKKDGFPRDDRFPIFLSEHAEKDGQPDIGEAWDSKVWDRAVISSRILKTCILVVTATAIGIAILLVGNPVALVANVTASWVDKPALQPGSDPSTSTIQSIAGTQDLQPTTRDAPTRDEIAAASQPADQSQTEIGQPPPEALFKQFQAWAAVEDARAQIEPVQPVQDAPVEVVQDTPAQVRPVRPAQDAPAQAAQDAPAQVRPMRPAQDAPAQVAQDAPAQVRSMKKHRRVRSVQNARAEVIRPQRNPRAKVREEQNARAPVPLVPDARAHQPVQNAQTPQNAQTQTPWLLQSFGWR